MVDKQTITQVIEDLDARIVILRAKEQEYSRTNSHRRLKLPHRGNEYYTYGEMEDMTRESKLTLEDVRTKLEKESEKAVDLTNARALMEVSQKLGSYLEHTHPAQYEAMRAKHSPEEIAMALMEERTEAAASG